LISDLDKEMEKRDVQSLIVFGDQTLGNPDLAYVVGAPLPRGGIYLKRQGNKPTLVVSNIDVGSAKAGRVKNIKTYSDYGQEKIYSRYPRDDARAKFYMKMIKEEGIGGRTVIGGKNDSSNTLQLVDSLRKGGLKVVGEKSPTIIESVRETKDRSEIERLRRVGKRTCQVVKETTRFLRRATIRGSKAYYKSKPLKVGDVRRVIGGLLNENDLVAMEDTIFAPGRRSADPHYRGENEDLVRAGVPIVFDIFPSEPEGYWHDTTRTYVLGSPQRKVKEMYDTVYEVQMNAVDMVKENAPCRELMLTACKLFESHGYPTARQLIKGNKEARVRGFIHSLGHGVGLTIGERPYLGLYGAERLRKGAVVTIEPGLYDPKYGGVRIEDIMVVGSPSENLTSLDKDMEL